MQEWEPNRNLEIKPLWLEGFNQILESHIIHTIRSDSESEYDDKSSED